MFQKQTGIKFVIDPKIESVIPAVRKPESSSFRKDSGYPIKNFGHDEKTKKEETCTKRRKTCKTMKA